MDDMSNKPEEKANSIMLWDDDPCILKGQPRKRPSSRERNLQVIQRRKKLRPIESLSERPNRASGKNRTVITGFLEKWSQGVYLQAQKGEEFQEVKEAVDVYLSNNPDLARDHFKARMVLFFLKNYVNTDPEFADMSFRERLEQASAMAGNFMSNNPSFNI